MEVEADGNESYMQTDNEEDSEEDGEVSFRENIIESETEESPQEEIVIAELQPSTSSVQKDQGHGSDNKWSGNKSNQDRIRQIDNEMYVKIQELQSLMNEGGLTESANLLKQCTPMLTGLNSSDNNRQERHIVKHGQNVNVNANVKQRNNNKGNDRNVNNESLMSKSMETIYDCAVPMKRNSSSSEDGMIDTSDEFIDEQLMGMDIRSINLHNYLPNNDASVVGKTGSQRGMTPSPRKDDRPQHNYDRYHYRREQQGATGRDQGAAAQAVLTPEEKSHNVIRDAEAAKAQFFNNTTGRLDNQLNQTNKDMHGIPSNVRVEQPCLITPTAVVDEGYIVVVLI